MKKLTTGPLKVKSALLVIALGATTGFAFDRLVFGQQSGIGWALFGALVGGCVVVVRRPSRPETWALLAGSLALAVWTLFRTAEYLVAIDVIAAVVLMGSAVTSQAFDPRIWRLRVLQHLGSFADQSIGAVGGGVRVIASATGGKDRTMLKPLVPYLRGATIALPIFGVFALLLSSADSVFGEFLGDAFSGFDVSLSEGATHLIVIALFAWLSIGFYAFAWQSPHVVPEGPSKGRRKRDAYVEIMIVLGSVTALFGLFVIFQFAYLFRGNAPATIDGLTYAEYARQGFFQLLAVAVLTAALVWVAMQWLRPLTGYRRQMFRLVCTLMVLMTGVILASALKRLGLYEEAYGFTRLRLLSHVFTFWIAGVLLLLVAQVHVDRLDVFLAGSVALGFIVLFGFNAINPDGWIAERNLDRVATDKEQDQYIATLSADAIPAVAVATRENRADRQLRAQLQEMSCRELLPAREWREWNWSESRARSAVLAAGIAPSAADCHSLAYG